MNFPRPSLAIPARARRRKPSILLCVKARRAETAPKGHSKSGRKAARLSGRRWAIVCPGGRPGFLGPCLEEENVCVCLIFSSALSRGGAGGCERCTWLVRARRQCCAAPALVGVAGFYSCGVFPLRILPCVFLGGLPGPWRQDAAAGQASSCRSGWVGFFWVDWVPRSAPEGRSLP